MYKPSKMFSFKYWNQMVNLVDNSDFIYAGKLQKRISVFIISEADSFDFKICEFRLNVSE